MTVFPGDKFPFLLLANETQTPTYQREENEAAQIGEEGVVVHSRVGSVSTWPAQASQNRLRASTQAQRARETEAQGGGGTCSQRPA